MVLKSFTLFLAIVLHISYAKVNFKVEPCEKGFYDLNEGPHWDEKRQVLWHVDINDFSVCRLNTTSGDGECHKLTDLLTLVHPYPNGEDILVTQRNKIVKLNWKTKKTEILAEVAPELNGKERFNDGKADASGRLWMGTIFDGSNGVVEGKGNLYKVEGNKFIKEAEGFWLTNGMTWSHDNKKMFVNDSEGRKIFVFDFDLEKGTLSNKKILVNCANNTDFTANDHPDGLTIDRMGHLWSASYAGGRVFKVNPETGKVEDSVSVPCPLTTSLAFGGPNFDELFVTAAYKNFGPDQRTAHPSCGKVHRITADAITFRGGVMYRPKDNTL
jgi:sugar lactone lactonase YvrE